MKKPLKDGMRIKLIKGIDNGTKPYMSWCAGNVPVGTCGTIRQRPSDPRYTAWEIKWDGIEPKSELDSRGEPWYFGIGEFNSEYYEEVI